MPRPKKIFTWNQCQMSPYILDFHVKKKADWEEAKKEPVLHGGRVYCIREIAILSVHNWMKRRKFEQCLFLQPNLMLGQCSTVQFLKFMTTDFFIAKRNCSTISRMQKNSDSELGGHDTYLYFFLRMRWRNWKRGCAPPRKTWRKFKARTLSSWTPSTTCTTESAPSPPPTLPTSKPSKSRQKPRVKSKQRTEVRTQTETGLLNNSILFYLFLAFFNF